jgi:major membrane immunogen (membrane-anchored lipoprotein)
MRNRLFFASLVFLLASFSGDQIYKDGSYTGISRAGYTSEPYYGFTRIDVNSGKIISVEFFVRDSAKHETFNDKYEKYFAGNDVYIQQCRNDWKGINSYPDSLLKYQDLSKVDVISGATWSYNIFKASVQEALSSTGPPAR